VNKNDPQTRIEDEQLPDNPADLGGLPGGEGGEEEEALFDFLLAEEGDPRLNETAAKLVGAVAFGREPALKQEYIDTTTPLLDALGFHNCLGVLSHMTPGKRLIASLAVLGGGVVFVKLQHPKPKEDNKEPQPVEHEETGPGSGKA